jgi:hypothetical protein
MILRWARPTAIRESATFGLVLEPSVFLSGNVQNVIAVSGGSGLVGGVSFDENHTSDFKMCRALLGSADAQNRTIEQVAFYDCGNRACQLRQ